MRMGDRKIQSTRIYIPGSSGKLAEQAHRGTTWRCCDRASYQPEICLCGVPNPPSVVAAFVGDLREGDLQGKRVLWLANTTLGMLVSASLALAVTGQSLARAPGLPSGHAIRQVDRLPRARAIGTECYVRPRRRPAPSRRVARPAPPTALRCRGDAPDVSTCRMWRSFGLEPFPPASARGSACSLRRASPRDRMVRPGRDPF